MSLIYTRWKRFVEINIFISVEQYMYEICFFLIYDETGDNLKVSVRRPTTNECLALAQDKKPNGPEVRGKK